MMWLAHLLCASLASTRMPLLTGLGDHHFIVTGNVAAQTYFDQGFALMCGFHHSAAIRSFETAAKLDPTCGMAYWGIASSNGPNLNVPTDPERCQEAIDALKKADKTLGNLTPLERGLIAAEHQRFGRDSQADREPLDLAFANAMRDLWHSYPTVADVGALYAEAVLDLHPWHQWDKRGAPQPGTLEAVGTLKQVLEIDPYDPLALHMTIHAWEASSHPENALGAANILRTLQPGLGHMMHMPSHIDVRVGNWNDAVVANERAIAVDDRQGRRVPPSDVYALYMLHNRHMLAYAAGMAGQSAKAIQAADSLRKSVPPQFLESSPEAFDWFFALPFEIRKRFGMWQEILQMPDPGEAFPYTQAMRFASRATAYAALGQCKLARGEQRLFARAKSNAVAQLGSGGRPVAQVLQIETDYVDGEILAAEGRNDEAVRRLRTAVNLEDDLDYDEPPDWVLPVRHALGAVLLRRHNYTEAVEVYAEDLAIHPKNGWALFGLAKAYRGLGDTKRSAEAHRQFVASWSTADRPIDSSCLCVR